MTKMYIVTRKDIPPGYQGVQSCHAVAELVGRGHRPAGWDDTMVWLSCKDESELWNLHRMCERNDLHPAEFLEPDLFNQMTSFAVFVPEDKWKLFAHLPLTFRRGKLSLTECGIMLSASCRVLVSEILKALRLKSLKKEWDKGTKVKIKQHGSWLAEFMEGAL